MPAILQLPVYVLQQLTCHYVTTFLSLQSEFLSRAGHPEPGCVKKYYRKLSEDFLTEADNIVRRMQAM